jgi:hypothetical protein
MVRDKEACRIYQQGVTLQSISVPEVSQCVWHLLIPICIRNPLRPRPRGRSDPYGLFRRS